MQVQLVVCGSWPVAFAFLLQNFSTNSGWVSTSRGPGGNRTASDGGALESQGHLDDAKSRAGARCAWAVRSNQQRVPSRCPMPITSLPEVLWFDRVLLPLPATLNCDQGSPADSLEAILALVLGPCPGPLDCRQCETAYGELSSVLRTIFPFTSTPYSVSIVSALKNSGRSIFLDNVETHFMIAHLIQLSNPSPSYVGSQMIVL
jgi:hypothetical protein